MRRFRRRRARPLWFPPFGVVLQDGEETFSVGPTTFSIIVPNDGTIGTVDIGLTFDFGQESLLKSNETGLIVTMSDLMDSAWRVRRIIGNVFATRNLPGEGAKDYQLGAFPAVWFAAGLMVRSVDGTGATNGAVDAVSRDDYDDPWIWRRTWILGMGQAPMRETPTQNIQGQGANLGAEDDNSASFSHYPLTNTAYGYVAGGPLVDQKTNRVVGPEERLILTLSTKGLPLTRATPGIAQQNVTGVFDFRLLGNLQRSSNRRNASR